MANLDSQALSVQAVARQQALTPRYVHMIFEGEGTTFSAFVLQQRLMLARSMLVGRRYAGSTVSEIAFAAGFSDISHFNEVSAAGSARHRPRSAKLLSPAIEAARSILIESESGRIPKAYEW